MISTCVKCGNHIFELTEGQIAGSAFRLYFVQCSSCGGVAGVQEFFNSGAMLEKLGAAVKKIAAQMNVQVDL